MTLTEKDENPNKIVMAKGRMFGGSNPGGDDIFRTRPDRPWGPPSLLYSGHRVFTGSKVAGAWR